MSARIHYAGREYTVASGDIPELREHIDKGLLSGLPFWLAVNFGEGRPSDALLLIAPGTTIALVADTHPGADSDAASADRATLTSVSDDTGVFDAFAAHSDS